MPSLIQTQTIHPTYQGGGIQKYFTKLFSSSTPLELRGLTKLRPNQWQRVGRVTGHMRMVLIIIKDNKTLPLVLVRPLFMIRMNR